MNSTAYVDGRKRENSLLNDRIIVASTTFRHSVQFGLLRNLSLDGKLCLHDGRNASFV